MIRITLVSLLCMACVSSHAQGPLDGFFKSKGELDAAFSATLVDADIFYAGTESINLARSQTILSGYATYGVTDKLGVVATLPMINFELQDIGVYAKYKLVGTKKFTLAPAFGISAPIYPYETENADAIGQRAVTFQPKLISQYTGKHWFIQAQGGYNYSIDPVPDAYVASAKVGYFRGKWYFDAWIDFQHGIDGKDYLQPNDEPINSFRELGVSYQRVGGVVYYQLQPKLGFFINGSQVLDGRNMSEFLSIGGGAVFKFNLNKESK